MYIFDCNVSTLKKIDNGTTHELLYGWLINIFSYRLTVSAQAK